MSGTQDNIYIITQVVSAAATLLVIIVAIYGDWIKFILLPPRIEITVHQSGELGKWGNGNKAIYYHLKVTNNRGWYAAKNCRVLLREISDDSMQMKPEVTDRRFMWSPADKAQQEITISNSPRILDFVFINQNEDAQLFVDRFTENGIIHKGQTKRFTIEFLSENFKPKKMDVFEVKWDGTWVYDIDEMKKHFSIKKI